MHCLTGGRFVLGLGRGIGRCSTPIGIPQITTAQMEDFAGLHAPPLARRGDLRPRRPGRDVARAPPRRDVRRGHPARARRLRAELAGARRPGFDEVVLHTFFTDETLARCVATVKRAAEQAGRDPDSVKVWSCFATVGDHIAEPTSG